MTTPRPSASSSVSHRLLRAILVLVLGVLLSLAAAYPAAATTPIFRDGNTTVPLAQGWLGADAAYTVPLSPTRTLWLFDDTLTANNIDDNRSNCHFIHNTIGIMECANTTLLTDCSITYHWSDDGNRTLEFWLTGKEAEKEPEFYWVLDAFINWYDKRLYVFLQRTKNVPWGLNFEEIGGEVVSVDNWQEEPSKWNKHYQIITNTNVSIVGQTAIAHQGPAGNPYPADPHGASYLYTHTYMTPLKGGRTTSALMRFPLSHMHNLSQSTGLYQYYTTANQWRNWTSDPTIIPADAVSYWQGNQIGTVRYSRHSQQWLNVSPSPQSYLGGGAVWSGSRDSLVAGWTPLTDLYLMPEVNRSSAAYNDEAWCYTTLEHVEWEVAGELAFTYVCNGHTLDAVLRNNSLYTPQLVRLPYPTIINKTAMGGNTIAGQRSDRGVVDA